MAIELLPEKYSTFEWYLRIDSGILLSDYHLLKILLAGLDL